MNSVLSGIDMGAPQAAGGHSLGLGVCAHVVCGASGQAAWRVSGAFAGLVQLESGLL